MKGAEVAQKYLQKRYFHFNMYKAMMETRSMEGAHKYFKIFINVAKRKKRLFAACACMSQVTVVIVQCHSNRKMLEE
jgi:hypothetical protein